MLFRLLGTTCRSAVKHAYAMLMLAEASLHTFDAEAGRQVNASLDRLGMDVEAKRGLISSLHHESRVSELLLLRCGLDQDRTDGSS